METFYITLLVFLAALAVFDLFVGVSNDAVNFLNSAIGSRVASFKTAIFVAAAGVLLGATFSSGMMEVARNGIFNPQMFNFNEIMIIFFTVMVADIILLDTFNSLGLPTSTTVSIVFELLGSAIAAASFKLLADGASLSDVMLYINSSKSLAIISGILISVVVAFVCGAVVQYLMRLVFSFHIENAYRRFGAVFGGVCITAIVYFLVMKGAKGASFMNPAWIKWIAANTGTIVVVLFVGFSALFQYLISVHKVNIFKIIILSGTFSLAFAFAGNDLVNFVGVPIGAYESFNLWKESGQAADSLMMSSLLKKTPTPTYLLLLAGLVMVLTLFFSRKARRVIQTSINLSASSQSNSQEQFGASMPSRVVVRSVESLGKVINQIMPEAMRKGLDSRFKPLKVEKGDNPPPFDYVRASVNLMVSAILIASATSLKLPLSTTYVTFMVAMGSSFADGAWDKESAVYRVSGVLAVISGWFMTAISASFLAALVATLILWGGEVAAILLGLVSVGLIIKTNFLSKKSSKTAKQIAEIESALTKPGMTNNLAINFDLNKRLFAETVANLIEDRQSKLRTVKKEVFTELERIRYRRMDYIRLSPTMFHNNDADEAVGLNYLFVVTNVKDVQSILYAFSNQCWNHVANRHKPCPETICENITGIADDLKQVTPENFQTNGEALLRKIEGYQRDFLRTVNEAESSPKASLIYLNCMLCAKEILERFEVNASVCEQMPLTISSVQK